jgi:hypothetical protein
MAIVSRHASRLPPFGEHQLQISQVHSLIKATSVTRDTIK